MHTVAFARPRLSQPTQTDSVQKQSHLWAALGGILALPIGELSGSTQTSFSFDLVNISYDFGQWSLHGENGIITLPLSSNSLYQDIKIIDGGAQFGIFLLGVDYKLLHAEWSPYIAAKIGALQMTLPSITVLGQSPMYSLQLGSDVYWYPMAEWTIGMKYDIIPNTLRVFGEVEAMVVPVPTKMTSGIFSMAKFHVGISTPLF